MWSLRVEVEVVECTAAVLMAITEVELVEAAQEVPEVVRLAALAAL